MGKDIIHIYFPSQRKAERGGNTNLLRLGSPASLPFDTIGKQVAKGTLQRGRRRRRRQRWQSKLDLLDTAGKRQRWPRREVKGKTERQHRGDCCRRRTARWRRGAESPLGDRGKQITKGLAEHVELWMRMDVKDEMERHGRRPCGGNKPIVQHIC